MPHEPGHTNSGYKVYGTNEPYRGRMVEIGGVMYSTVGGALEGNSLQLVRTSNASSTMRDTSQTQNDNPVTRLFTAPSSPRYRRSDNNRLVPIGAKLHQHQDGTIMTEHTMQGAGTPDGSVVVNLDSGANRTTSRTQTSTGGMSSGRRTQTSTGGMGGGTSRSGGGGGGY